MADLWDRLEDSFDNLTDIRRVCRSCGNLSRNLVDGWCVRCTGQTEDLALEEVARVRHACEKAREAQRRRRPEMFDADGNWAPFRRTR